MRPTTELAQLELLADVEALLGEVTAWAERAPAWPPARLGQTLVRRMASRAENLRLRWEAPLVVATLGGTGTGKSTLVNALCGAEVTTAGRQRPTTIEPVLICRPDITPGQLGIDPTAVRVVHQPLAALRDLVLLDCPDPDTTEDELARSGTNLARLRALLPFVDVLLVTSTQQKYRDARLLDELSQAARGARLVFVQTHADLDDDIRDDWRRSLGENYAAGEMFFIDGPAAWADAATGRPPQGEFARLWELLSRELAGAAGQRIRRANFLDLVAETLATCRVRYDESLPAVAQLETATAEQRARLAGRLAQSLGDELLAGRRPWEARLVAEVSSRWGLSPFSLVLRAWQGLGGLLTSTLLLRARTPAQVALWGAVEGGRVWRKRRTEKQADDAVSRLASWTWDEAELRTAAIILEGYVGEAGLSSSGLALDRLAPQAQRAAEGFVAQASGELQGLVRRLAARHAGWGTRLFYETAWSILLAVILFRLGKNFFYDSWLAPQPVPLYDLTFFVHALFWIVLWSGLLLSLFTIRLRRGLAGELAALAGRWGQGGQLGELFADLDDSVRAVRRHRDDLARLERAVGETRDLLADHTERWGHQRPGLAAELPAGRR